MITIIYLWLKDQQKENMKSEITWNKEILDEDGKLKRTVMNLLQ